LAGSREQGGEDVPRDDGGRDPGERRSGHDPERIRADLEALAQVPHRYAGTEGEREMLHQVRNRLPESAQPATSGGRGAVNGPASRIEGFVAYTSPGLVLGAHAMALLVAGLLGLRWPLLAALLCALATVSLGAEGSGMYSVLRRVLPKSASYNLVWRTLVDEPLGTLVLTAPLDTPRWRPNRPRWLRRPMQLLMAAACVLTLVITLRALAEPWGRPTQGMYVASLVIMGAAAAVGAVAHRRAAGVHEDPSGPAALLELIRRFEADPLPGVDVWAVFTGCGHAYQNGMHAFLAMRRGRMKEPVLVVSLAEPGRPGLRGIVAEGPLWPQHHRPTGPALVERLRWVGLDLPSKDSPRITDARAAMLWGYRALALGGGSEPWTLEDTVRAVDVTEAIVRLYAEDLRRVPDLHPHLRHVLPQPSGASDVDEPTMTSGMTSVQVAAERQAAEPPLHEPAAAVPPPGVGLPDEGPGARASEVIR
jgi:hypothetical protein